MDVAATFWRPATRDAYMKIGPHEFRYFTGRALLASVVQGLHSAVTFGVTVWILRVAPSEEFAKVAAFFLIATIFAAGTMQWITLLWIKGRCSKLSVIYVTSISGLITTVISISYLWVVGLMGGIFDSVVLLLPVSLWSLFVYYGVRRKLLLENSYGRALWMDTARTLLTAALLLSPGFGLFSFTDYLLWVVLAHLAPSMILFLEPSRPPLDLPILSKLAYARRGSALSKGERGIVFAWLGNALFGQASILLAPIVVGITAFAAVRAYEIFFVIVLFAAQVLDPIYSTRAKQWRHITTPSGMAEAWVVPIIVLVAPVAALACLELAMPTQWSPSGLVIPNGYRYANGLIWGVILVSICIAVQAPMRWYITVSGEGRKLFGSTLVVAILSLLLMVMLRGQVASFWIPIAAKIAFEMTMVGVLFWIACSEWRSPKLRHFRRSGGSTPEFAELVATPGALNQLEGTERSGLVPDLTRKESR